MLLIFSILFRIVSFEYFHGIEFFSPILSFNSLSEGVFFITKNQSPYSSSFYLLPPAYFMFHSKYFFLLFDLIIGYLIYYLGNKKSYSNPEMMASMYLLNPITILNCGKTVTPFEQIPLLLYLIYQENEILSSVFLSFASYLSIYPVYLIGSLKSKRSFLYYLLSLGAIFYLNFVFMGSWDFLKSYYNKIMIQDLTPNYGITWYFFTEVFEHFRVFFLYVFHLHPVLLLYPLYIRFNQDKFSMAIILISIISIFKPYHTYADLIYLILFSFDQNFHFYHFLLLASMVLGPVFFNTWIQLGTGNSNFFYFLTLVYLYSQIKLAVEFVQNRMNKNQLE